jgi:hypothetical protein
MFDHTMWQVNQERHGELLKVAETQRLIRVKTEKPSRRNQGSCPEQVGSAWLGQTHINMTGGATW